MKSERHYWFAGALGRRLLDALLGSVRFQVLGQEPHKQVIARKGGVIYTLWHGRLLPLTYHHRKQNIATLISRSADGEYIARIVERWGYKAVRGSSSKGGSEALRELVKLARGGRSLAFTPDGPRGPRQKLKPGVLTAAQLTGQPILPLSGAATRAWWVEGWDRFLIPKPFSKVVLRYGQLIDVPRSASQADLNALAERVEAVLNELTEQVDADVRA